ncbi:helix-turn-helix domain-containing protein [Oceanicella actignis]|uniref:helix-turn-helix domain-containing protein n=1 Tax=Oceanicella actignis TaxID=1189325 RepID=UPI001253F0EC|nr:helix-turn-helix domain-containing protein [Oceanicella actignis]TYO91447.1 helix-turn-helix protein [Oceanicella actignis]
MSFRLMSAILEIGPADKSELLLLLALADYANEDGECWPSIDGLCKKSRLSARGVQSVLRRLEKAGWVRIESGGGRANTNRYTIVLPDVRAENPASDAPFDDQNPAHDAGYDEKTPHEKHRFSARNPAADAPYLAKTPQPSAKNPAAAAPEPIIGNCYVSVMCARAREDDHIPEDTALPTPDAPGPQAEACDLDELFADVLHAAGLDGGLRLPTYWMPPTAQLHIRRWLDAGLRPDEILDVVRHQRARFDAPPTSPKAYDRAMRAYLGAKRDEPLEASRHEDANQPVASVVGPGGRVSEDFLRRCIDRAFEKIEREKAMGMIH